MSVVSYCLYDKIPSGVSKDKMVNTTNGKKNTSMEVEFYFQKNGSKYKIHRSRGQSTGVHLYENDKDITPASVVEVNSKIEELVGFSYNLFSQIVLFSGNSRPFLDLSIGEQRTLIEELFKITVLSRKAVALKKQMSETTKQIDLMKLLIKQQESQNEGYRKRLIDAERRVTSWESTHESDVQRQIDLLAVIESVDFDSEEQLHQRITELNQEVGGFEAASKRFNDEKMLKSREKSPLMADLSIKKSDLDKTERDLKKIQVDLIHLRDAKCPYCFQNYADAKTKLGELEDKETELTGKISSLTDEVKSLTQEVSDFNEDRDSEIAELELKVKEFKDKAQADHNEIRELKDVLSYKSYKDHVNAQAGITAIRDKIAVMKLETNPHVDALENLLNEGEIKIDYDSLNTLAILKEHQSFMSKLLTDKNSYVRKNLISTTTPFLNKRIGYYLERLNLPHVVLFQPDMTCEITQLGRSLDHGNLSNGEKKRLNLALCLSFRDVLTYLHSKVNVLLTDEVDGGSLDSNCVDLLITLLKKKAWDDNISIFIISHRPEFEGRCDRTFVVRKEQGFSSLIIQPDA
jgi:DNA repair exonuclease SbcCD ATPase subunit